MRMRTIAGGVVFNLVVMIGICCDISYLLLLLGTKHKLRLSLRLYAEHLLIIPVNRRVLIFLRRNVTSTNSTTLYRPRIRRSVRFIVESRRSDRILARPRTAGSSRLTIRSALEDFLTKLHPLLVLPAVDDASLTVTVIARAIDHILRHHDLIVLLDLLRLFHQLDVLIQTVRAVEIVVDLLHLRRDHVAGQRHSVRVGILWIQHVGLLRRYRGDRTATVEVRASICACSKSK